MSRIRTTGALGAAVLLSLAACKLEPRTPELRYGLNTKAVEANDDLAADGAAQAHLRGALEMLYGTPHSPGYLLLQDWVDDEFDPNRGDLALSDEAFEAIKADNRRAFASQLAAIRAGEFDALDEPRYAPDLWRRWQVHLAALPEDPDAKEDADSYSWREDALYLFEGYYPTLAASADMYRQQCYHCHGAEGGGNGSTADYLEPRPRDYRRGTFKFTALNNKARPRHEDLMRILREGIYTTAMPSFRRFSDAELSGLADYVRLLSRRGETELLLIDEYDPDEGLGLETIQETYAFVFERWSEGDDEVIVYDGDVPHATPERIAHGRELFMEEKAANCVKCHGTSGRGDGPSSVERNPETGEMELVKDDWGNPIKVRDLTRGVYRFGRRPIDLYRRIYAGINGTPMPAHYGMQITEPDGTQRPLNEDDIWDLVHFVRSLSQHPLAQATTHTAGSAAHGGGH